MAKKQVKVAAIRSNKQASGELFPFRVVVRGTVTKGKKAIRVRKVFTTKAHNEGEAAVLAQPRVDKACKALDNPYMTVLPPLSRAA